MHDRAAELSHHVRLTVTNIDSGREFYTGTYQYPPHRNQLSRSH